MSYHHYRQPSLSPRAPHQQSGCSVCGYGQWFPFVIQHHKAMAVCVISTFQCYLSHSFVSCLPINAPRNTASILTERTIRLNTSVCQVQVLTRPLKDPDIRVEGISRSGSCGSIDVHMDSPKEVQLWLWTGLEIPSTIFALRWIGREAMVRRKSTLCLPGTLRVFVKWQDLSFRSRITSHYLELVVVYSSSI